MHARVHSHTHKDPPTHPSPAPQPPSVRPNGAEGSFSGMEALASRGGGGRGDTGTHAGGRGDTGGAVPTPHCRGSVGLVTAEPLSFSVPLREGTKVPRGGGGSLTWERDMGIWGYEDMGT